MEHVQLKHFEWAKGEPATDGRPKSSKPMTFNRSDTDGRRTEITFRYGAEQASDGLS